jgi:hypothetical protein
VHAFNLLTLASFSRNLYIDNISPRVSIVRKPVIYATTAHGRALLPLQTCQSPPASAGVVIHLHNEGRRPGRTKTILREH